MELVQLGERSLRDVDDRIVAHVQDQDAALMVHRDLKIVDKIQ